MEYGQRKRKSRREIFLETMNKLVPWQRLKEKIRPHYFAGNRGRPPKGIEPMLRMYFLQVWFSLADESAEEQIYDSYAMKKFIGIDFMEEGAPDAAALPDFRHLLEKHGLQKSLFETVNESLEEAGKIMHGGSILDAAIIEAPASAKNSAKSRDTEMHQAKKGNEWHFGMKAHVGADAGSGMVHSAETAAANASDIETARKLIREDDGAVNAGAGYAGIENRKEICEDEHLSKTDYRINKKKGAERKQEAALYKEPMKHLEYIGEPKREREIEYMKSKVRSKAEHIFYLVKRLFGYRKAVYRGLMKNTARLYMLFAGANLLKWARTLRPNERPAAA
jgi:IS5 family transposase